MMSLNGLTPAKGSVHPKGKRLGRGQGSGKGGTSTRGHKGAKSRSGYSKKLGFEGGQMPLQRRIPKGGFKNINRKEYVAVNLDTLERLVSQKKINDRLDKNKMCKLGLISKNDLVKVLGRGTLSVALKVSADKFSAKAKEIIVQAGGEAITI